ncbi:MAG: LuxR family transcriptional regulator, partial [Bacteroidetes bacterium]|nr:LuxR family transcriptional regulator [Bacteroidota bacterium]
EFEIRIDEVQITTGTGMTEKCSLTQDAPVFDSTTKGITIDYSVPEFEKFLITEYHYILEGSDNNWTTWNRNTSISFTNLAHGEYNFKVRAKINNTLTRNTASYQFSIGKPWYLSTTFLFLYCLGGLLFFVLVHWFYKRYYRKQRERILEKTTKDLKIKELAAQKEIVELKNDRLNQDIEARNRELAIATMNMISKNTTLNNIKNEITSQGNLKELTSVIKLLDDTINSKKEWKFFEEAFNHADQDFFKKVTHLHPQLTPNDLRLCVYLRLNLSSKEIAPLLNISPRSVEIKRYRLRKKIGLEREINLNEYFIRL